MEFVPCSFLDDLPTMWNNDLLLPKILSFAYSSARIEGNLVGGRTKILEQAASTVSGQHTAALSIFCRKQGVLEERGARPLEETASTVLDLRIASTALFLSKEKRKYFLNHSLLFLISLISKWWSEPVSQSCLTWTAKIAAFMPTSCSLPQRKT